MRFREAAMRCWRERRDNAAKTATPMGHRRVCDAGEVRAPISVPRAVIVRQDLLRTAGYDWGRHDALGRGFVAQSIWSHRRIGVNDRAERDSVQNPYLRNQMPSVG
jgi:hypothetical protein